MKRILHDERMMKWKIKKEDRFGYNENFIIPHPPIPRRSLTTQLSEHSTSSPVFDDKLSESSDSICDNNASLSGSKHVPKQMNSSNLRKSDNDFLSSMNITDECLKCGQYIPLKNSSFIINEESESELLKGLNMNCACKERIEQLNIKFKRVRELIEKNEIRILNKSPPSFVPELPALKKAFFKENAVKITSKSNLSTSISYPDFRDLIIEEVFDSLTNNNNLNKNIEYIDKDNVNKLTKYASRLYSNKTTWTHSSDLCRKCLCSSQSPTIEDIPKLLPTDALVRPQFGLSYSLEDDMSPGVKEIITSSTYTRNLFKVNETLGSFSTFSSSASSLGYVSSQSELELNNLAGIPNKIPLANFKSITLPNGLDRFPFYSSSQEFNSDVVKPNSLESIESSNLLGVKQLNQRSSVEQLPTEKPKKTAFLFSRFSKKDKKKSEK